MTIKELYEWAVKYKVQDLEINEEMSFDADAPPKCMRAFHSGKVDVFVYYGGTGKYLRLDA